MTLIQLFALLALVTVVRDHRPDPRVDAATWEHMGMFVEFTAIVPLAMLIVVVASAGLHALDSSITAVDRSSECSVILRLFGVATALVILELVSFGLWKGIWEMFGLMAAIAVLDLALVFLVFRYLDSDKASPALRQTAPTRSPD